MHSLLDSARARLKDLCLDARSGTARSLIDRALRWQRRDQIMPSDYDRRHAAILDALQPELRRVLGFATDFEAELYVRRFESDFANRCDRRFGVGTQSGTSALQLSLLALGIGPGDEVVTVPYTYVATALAIANTGARPVFVDVEPDTFNLDPGKLEAAITPRAKAIVPVHLFGQMADMRAINAIATRHGLKVVEDACQAFGAERRGRKAGSEGHAGCFSFSMPKTYGGCGNGGMIVTNDRDLAGKARRLRNPEWNDPAVRLSGRTPCYLDPIQVAFLRAKRPQVDAWIDRRRSQAAFYRSTLAGVTLPAEVPDSRHAYYQFAIRTPRCDALRRWLRGAGIRTAKPYSGLHLARAFADLGYPAGSFPVAEALARDTLLLPISPFLTREETGRVAEAVRSFFAVPTPTRPLVHGR